MKFFVSDLKYSTRFKAILVPSMRETEDKNIDYVLHELAKTFKTKKLVLIKLFQQLFHMNFY